jgi:hypothetical protein
VVGVNEPTRSYRKPTTLTTAIIGLSAWVGMLVAAILYVHAGSRLALASMFVGGVLSLRAAMGDFGNE